MESTTNTVEDQLIDGLQFRLPAGASYITDRKSVSFFPHGGNDYKPSGVKVIKFVLTGNDWLDPSTVKFQFQVNNTATPGTLIALPNGVNTMRPILLPSLVRFAFSDVCAYFVKVKLLKTLIFITGYIICFIGYLPNT